jgi:hypothetical protein
MYDKVEFVDENKLINGLDLLKVKSILKERINSCDRSGWYFQQFLKMGYSYLCTEEAYIVWDADTIPLNGISLIDKKTNKFLFTMKKEFHKPYFNTINKLFDGYISKFNEKSFIAEHMIIDKKIMLEMIEKIENNKRLKGNKFYEKILYAIDKNDLNKSGFSEFETYGNFVMRFHKNKYRFRELKTLREGIKYLGENPTEKKLKWAKESYDIISIESSDQISKFSILCNNNFFSNHYSLRTIVEIRNTIRSIYRKCTGKSGIDFD